MTTTTIAEILKTEPGKIIPQVHGTISVIAERYPPTGWMEEVNSDGSKRLWSLQTIILEQDGAQIEVQIANKEPIPTEAKGKSLYLIAHQKARGGMSGVKVDVDEGRKLLRVSASGELVFAEPASKISGSSAREGSPGAGNLADPPPTVISPEGVPRTVCLGNAGPTSRSISAPVAQPVSAVAGAGAVPISRGSGGQVGNQAVGAPIVGQSLVHSSLVPKEEAGLPGGRNIGKLSSSASAIGEAPAARIIYSVQPVAAVIGETVRAGGGVSAAASPATVNDANAWSEIGKHIEGFGDLYELCQARASRMNIASEALVLSVTEQLFTASLAWLRGDLPGVLPTGKPV